MCSCARRNAEVCTYASGHKLRPRLNLLRLGVEVHTPTPAMLERDCAKHERWQAVTRHLVDECAPDLRFGLPAIDDHMLDSKGFAGKPGDADFGIQICSTCAPKLEANVVPIYGQRRAVQFSCLLIVQYKSLSPNEWGGGLAGQFCFVICNSESLLFCDLHVLLPPAVGERRARPYDVIEREQARPQGSIPQGAASALELG